MSLCEHTVLLSLKLARPPDLGSKDITYYACFILVKMLVPERTGRQSSRSGQQQNSPTIVILHAIVILPTMPLSLWKHAVAW